MRLCACVLCVIAVASFGCSREQVKDTASDAAERAGARVADVAGGGEVVIKNLAFNPQTVDVKAGAEVKWMNEDPAAHTVTSENKAFDSGKLETKKEFGFRFLQKGEFPYYCDIHGAASMSGVVRVT